VLSQIVRRMFSLTSSKSPDNVLPSEKCSRFHGSARAAQTLQDKASNRKTSRRETQEVGYERGRREREPRSGGSGEREPEPDNTSHLERRC
jgi:hypothetical protein